ncbi:MAG: SRPBCC family protein [Anaerolineales bacterium]|nr:SRPBCC family protein [Anaerolineales bacterium]
MTIADFNPTIIDEGLGALAIAGYIVSSPLTRPWYSKWGATAGEVEMTLPGDEFVPNPVLESTRAITIQAPATAVWPWLVQMGQGRGGLYSYERLENLVGCDMHNADRIIPEYQQLKVGDKVRLVPEGREPYFLVSAVEPGRAIILGGDDPPTTWVFILQPIDNNSTRLIVRWRQDYEPSFGNIIGWRVFTDPITFVMERKLLQGIKARVEAVASNRQDAGG